MMPYIFLWVLVGGRAILRAIGLSLAILGGIGVALTLSSMLYVLREGWDLWPDYWGYFYTLVFSAYGLLAGIFLIKRTPPQSGPLFWIGVGGALICAPLVAYQLFGYFLSDSDRFDDFSFFVSAGYGDFWWPPRGDTIPALAYRYSEDFDLQFRLRILSSYFGSFVIWADLPFGLCLWAIWGKRGGVGDKFFAWVAFGMAGLTAIRFVETAITHYEISSFVSDDETVYDFSYYPEPGWYVSYAIVILLLTVAGLLLRRRQPK